MPQKVIRIDEEVKIKLDALRGGKPYDQILRQLLNLPEVKHSKPRKKKRSRLVRAIRILIR